MQEIHDGDYRNHAGGRFLTHKVMYQGYYWPKMFDDAKDYVKSACNVKGLVWRQTDRVLTFTPYAALGLSCNRNWT